MTKPEIRKQLQPLIKTLEYLDRPDISTETTLHLLTTLAFRALEIAEDIEHR